MLVTLVERGQSASRKFHVFDLQREKYVM